jgi:hypothetical protein
MGRARINFNEDGLGNIIFNNVQNAFHRENGHYAEAYGGYYDKKDYWESDLSKWLSQAGYPCVMYSERKNYPISTTMAYDPIGVEMDQNIVSLFVITWS